MTNETEAPDLLPCPFCGQTPKMYGAQHKLGQESIDCDAQQCPIQPTTGYTDHADAVRAWNTRADLSDAKDKRIEELEAGKWVTKAYDLEFHLGEAQERIAELEAGAVIWRRNLRDSFDAMCAMRNDINNLVPMPSLESDLLQGPETSTFCSEVSFAVIERLNADAARIAELEAKLAHATEQYRLIGMDKIDLVAKVAELEAKLATASVYVEHVAEQDLRLGWLDDWKDTLRDVVHDARATLAELKGTDDE